jgi:hypothetical protein
LKKKQNLFLQSASSQMGLGIDRISHLALPCCLRVPRTTREAEEHHRRRRRRKRRHRPAQRCHLSSCPTQKFAAVICVQHLRLAPSLSNPVGEHEARARGPAAMSRGPASARCSASPRSASAAVGPG